MPKTDFERVHDFHTHFELPVSDKPRELTPTEFAFRRDRLIEEIDEFVLAYNNGDLAGEADALIDLSYICLGTAVMMGLPWEKLFTEVHRVNMMKRRVIHIGESRFNSPIDIVKPEGWEGPKVQQILDEATNE